MKSSKFIETCTSVLMTLCKNRFPSQLTEICISISREYSLWVSTHTHKTQLRRLWFPKAVSWEKGQDLSRAMLIPLCYCWPSSSYYHIRAGLTGSTEFKWSDYNPLLNCQSSSFQTQQFWKNRNLNPQLKHQNNLSKGSKQTFLCIKLKYNFTVQYRSYTGVHIHYCNKDSHCKR